MGIFPPEARTRDDLGDKDLGNLPDIPKLPPPDDQYYRNCTCDNCQKMRKGHRGTDGKSGTTTTPAITATTQGQTPPASLASQVLNVLDPA